MINIPFNFSVDTTKAIEKIEKARLEGTELKASDFNVEVVSSEKFNIKAVIS